MGLCLYITYSTCYGFYLEEARIDLKNFAKLVSLSRTKHKFAQSKSLVKLKKRERWDSPH